MHRRHVQSEKYLVTGKWLIWGFLGTLQRETINKIIQKIKMGKNYKNQDLFLHNLVREIRKKYFQNFGTLKRVPLGPNFFGFSIFLNLNDTIIFLVLKNIGIDVLFVDFN